jgi:hypothetical protein
MRLRFLAASDPNMKNRDDVNNTKRGIFLVFHLSNIFLFMFFFFVLIYYHRNTG